MEEVVNRIAVVRQKVSPRTSYATSGMAASTVLVAGGKCADTSRCAIGDGLLTTGEFEKYGGMKGATDVDGHVVVFVDPDSLGLDLVKEIMVLRKTNLVFVALISASAASASASAGGKDVMSKAAVTDSLSLLAQVTVVVDEFPLSGTTLITVYSNSNASSSNSTSSSSSSRSADNDAQSRSIGFNGQPSVQSRQQFKYLWEGATRPQPPQQQQQQHHSAGPVLSPAQDAKLRVLQRLADKELFDKSKWTIEKWDATVSAGLARGLDDFGIYSMLRVYYTGKSLEEALRIDLDGAGKGEVEVEEEENPDGRANYMVDMTLECVPEELRSGQIRTMLDYGCAEGAITAQLCRKLELPTERAYGADVRCLNPNGFNFVLLPSEGTRPSHEPLLPTINDGTIDLVTAAMVFHHVTHAQTALGEIRRVVSPTGAFVMREHHCTSAEMAVFLDIIHGLYGLAWKDPVEDPRFIDEYKVRARCLRGIYVVFTWCS